MNFSFTEIDNGQKALLESGKAIAIGTNAQTVGAGVVVDGVTVGSEQVLTVAAGGKSTKSLVNDGGKEVATAGGLASGSQVRSAGVQEVAGRAEGTLVTDGGAETVQSGGLATGAKLGGGFSLTDLVLTATQSVSMGGTATGTTVGFLGVALMGGLVTSVFVDAGSDES
ncbi:hypothetical protein [Methylobacterium planeticum]|uniref:hypothetical protein n=1 Tax=Methylobacterium planeticum TaxID=2615211 RepID=UPI0017832751|nr:hypothetical protein [Methylobacterium planeticum]